MCIVFLASFNIGYSDDCRCVDEGFFISTVSPVDVFCSTGRYFCGVTRNALFGVKQVLESPFKTEICIPRIRRYKVVPRDFCPIKK